VSGLEGRLDLVRDLGLRVEGELDLLAGLLLERGDDLPDRLVLLGVVAFLPPHDEIGGLRAGRRHPERQHENNDLPEHDVAFLNPMAAGCGVFAIEVAPVPGGTQAR
jgi:hypothetical protein